MKKNLVALLLAVAMLVSVMAPAVAEEATTPLVVAYGNFSEKFSPFYYETVYDGAVADMTTISLMTNDRLGAIVYNAIEGETIPYNGTDYTYTGPANLTVSYDPESDTTTYTAKLRDDIYFSDGVQLTADDLIFTYYGFLDTSYVGSNTISSYDIIGLQDYRTQTTSDVYDKYATLAADIYAAGKDHEWSESDAWTKEMQDGYWATMDATWTEDVQAIVDYVAANYLSDDYATTINSTADEIAANEGLKVAFGMVMWGYGAMNDEGLLAGAVTGNTWDIANGVYPTAEDYMAETYAAFEGDPDAYWSVEAADSTDVHGTADESFISEWGVKDEGMDGGVKSITGITKIDDFTVEVKTNGYEAPAVYSILGPYVTPLHYYGDVNLYDYENGMYGFERGHFADLASTKTTQPMGAGPYKFVKYENRVVYFEANETYYKGAPKIKEVQFKETNSAEVAAAVATGTVDGGEMTGSRTRFEEVMGYNTDNGEITGNVITTYKYDNNGYGYIGMNADTMNVGGEPGSEASKDLRKAFGTIIAVYRDVAIDSYYGEAASIINYPISNSSWAAPQPTDEDYKLAFSVDVDGNDIFTSDMNEEAKYEAALQAAIGYFKAAGYTWDDATSTFTAAPEGAKLSYECMIPADGIGDHPNFGILTGAADALATIGIELKINDLADSAVLWEVLDVGTQEMWSAAWSSGIDPDMYQVYHSSSIIGAGGSDSNHYHLAEDELDALIVEGRTSDDQTFRKAVYKQALDFIVDYAVEIPVYQRQNCIIWSTERVNIDTMTPDLTPFYGWMNGIHNIEMR